MGKLIVTILAAVLSVATAFFSFKVSGDRKELRGSNDALKTDIAGVRKDLASTKTELDTTKKSRDDAQSKADSLTTETTSLKGELETAKSKSTAMETELTETKNQLGTVRNDFEGLKGKLAESFGAKPIEEIVDQIKKSQDEIRTLTEGKKQVEDRLASVVRDLQQKNEIEVKRNSGEITPGINGKIVAVNAQWGFVVLNVGRQQGVNENAVMTVVRGNQPVAQLKIATVDQNTAVADVVRTTAEQRIYLGDQVISN